MRPPMADVDPAIIAAIEIAIQHAKANDKATKLFGTATIVQMNSEGSGIHDIVIDGDVDEISVPAHQLTAVPLSEGARVAVAFVPPHQAWIIGELTRTSAACRVWMSTDTSFTDNDPTLIVYDELSYDYEAAYDVDTGIYTAQSNGLHHIGFRFRTPTLSGTVRVSGAINVNEEAVSQGLDIVSDESIITIMGNDVIELDEGDEVTITATQHSGTLTDVVGDADRPDLNYFFARRI